VGPEALTAHGHSTGAPTASTGARDAFVGQLTALAGPRDATSTVGRAKPSASPRRALTRTTPTVQEDRDTPGLVHDDFSADVNSGTRRVSAARARYPNAGPARSATAGLLDGLVGRPLGVEADDAGDRLRSRCSPRAPTCSQPRPLVARVRLVAELAVRIARRPTRCCAPSVDATTAAPARDGSCCRVGCARGSSLDRDALALAWLEVSAGSPGVARQVLPLVVLGGSRVAPGSATDRPGLRGP